MREAFASPWYNELRDFLKEEYSRFTVYPDMHDIFNALKATPYAAVKAVILGQDPYHNPLEAHGMCFSVKPGVRIPPSLQNIYKEMNDDLGLPIPKRIPETLGRARSAPPEHYTYRQAWRALFS